MRLVRKPIMIKVFHRAKIFMFTQAPRGPYLKRRIKRWDAKCRRITHHAFRDNEFPDDAVVYLPEGRRIFCGEDGSLCDDLLDWDAGIDLPLSRPSGKISVNLRLVAGVGPSAFERSENEN